MEEKGKQKDEQKWEDGFEGTLREKSEREDYAIISLTSTTMKRTPKTKINRSKDEKNDERYTQLSEIEGEVCHYPLHSIGNEPSYELEYGNVMSPLIILKEHMMSR